MAPTGDKRRGWVTYTCYVTQVVTAIVLGMSSFISFHSLGNLTIKIRSRTVYGNTPLYNCILYVGYNETTNGSYPLIELGKRNACELVLGGEILLVLFALIFVFVPCIKAYLKRAGSCDIVVELALHVVASVFAFHIAMVLSSGLRDTCRTVSQTQNGTCRELVIPEPDSSGNSTSVSFYLSVKVSEGTAWLGWLTLVINIALYLVWMCIICVQQRKAKENRELLVTQLEEHGHHVEDDSKTA